ncbi:MAG: hypothetical protein K2X64_02205, partial [Rhodocyclaceae bacterium]|nr:hypothetical protein [Rhodocyclaceae bacterium]
CQRLMFKLINKEALTAHLRSVADKESIEIEDEAIELIARRSGGGLRDALSNLDQASLLSAPGSPATVSDLLRMLGALHEDVLLTISKQIAGHEGQQVISSMHKLLGEGREPRVVLQELSQHFLNLMKGSYLAGSGSDAAALESLVLGSKDYLAGLMEQTKLFEKAELSQIVEALNRLDAVCRNSSQPAMQLEIGLLGLCHRHDIHMVKDLLARVERLEEMIGDGSSISVNRAPAAPRPLPQMATAAPPARPRESSSPVQSQAPAPRVAMEPSAPVSANSHGADESRADNDDAAQAPPVHSGASFQQDDEGGVSGGSAGASSDVEELWQQVLDELQRRHVPTFSLASTHAFPLSVSDKELTVGVLKDNLQDMLEKKIDHLKKAVQVVTGQDIHVRIRVTEGSAPAPKKTATVAAARTSSPRSDRPEPSEEGRMPVAESRSESEAGDAPAKDPEAAARQAAKENESTMVKEAYKLFEGPGSRRLT